MRGQTLVELKAVCPFLQCHFLGLDSSRISSLFFYLLPKEDSVRNWDDQGSYAAMIGISDVRLVFVSRIWWRDASRIMRLAKESFQSTMQHLHEVRETLGESAVTQLQNALNCKQQRVFPSFPTFPNCVIPNCRACCVSCLGLVHGPKPNISKDLKTTKPGT